MNKNKLKLLIVTNELYPHCNANSGIAYRIADELINRHNCDVTVMGYEIIDRKRINRPVEIKTISIRSLSEYSSIQLSNKGRLDKYLKLLFHPLALKFAIDLKFLRNAKSVEYVKKLKKLNKSQCFDCAIGFSEPRDILIALSAAHLVFPFISYKLDPWSTRYDREDSLLERRQEKLADDASSAIVVTNLIKRDYDKIIKHYDQKKIAVMDFPGIVKQSFYKNKNSFNDGKIHCVYAGGLYKDIRNPTYMIRLFQELNDEQIVLHILGHLYDDFALPENLPENIIYHGELDSESALSFMYSANVLVNLGNTIANQMPSKILTYFSLGKPIINIVKINDCPTLPYMKKYPLAINIFETPRPLKEDINKVKTFCFENSNKMVEFDVVENLYKTCTPLYVGNEIYKLICEIITPSL